jgi:hypothetical protein
MSNDPLKDIQDEVKNVLTAHSYFTGVEIITERKGDILNEIERNLGKLGICVVVETITGKPEYGAIGSYSLDLNVGITVTENVLINQGATGTRKPASEMVAMIMCLLNPNRPGVPAWVEQFSLVNDAGGLLIYQLECKAAAGFMLTED